MPAAPGGRAGDPRRRGGRPLGASGAGGGADGRIDWRGTATRLHDFIRAQTRPYPGAFTCLPDGRRVRIWRAAPDPRPFLGQPGAVAGHGEDGSILITCGGGALRVLEAQVDGEEPGVPPRAIFSSRRMRLV